MKSDLNEIRKILLKLGFRPDLLGYNMIMQAIYLYMIKIRAGHWQILITDIYRDIARTYNRTYYSVEHAIRTAIKRANKLRKYKSSGELIAIIAEQMAYRERKQPEQCETEYRPNALHKVVSSV